MKLNELEYRQRLRNYSKSTLQLIMDLNHTSKEAALQKLEITTDSELNEEEVAEKLKALKALFSK